MIPVQIISSAAINLPWNLELFLILDLEVLVLFEEWAVYTTFLDNADNLHDHSYMSYFIESL
jgi:hypothetical protein